MGTKSQSPIEDRSPRQLYRSESDRIVAGICGGLGRYFGMDPIVVRALFVLVTLVGGSGGLFYLILWLIIPAEPRDRVLSERVVQPEVPQLEGDFEVTTGLKIKNCWWGLVLISLGLVFCFLI